MTSANQTYVSWMRAELLRTGDPLHEGLAWEEIDSFVLKRDELDELLHRIESLEDSRALLKAERFGLRARLDAIRRILGPEGPDDSDKRA